MYVGKIKSIRFEPFIGTRFPPKHPKAGELVPRDVAYYALPGGGVSTEKAIVEWAIEYGCSVKVTTRYSHGF